MEIKMTPLLDSIRLLDISDEEYFGSGYRNYISNSRLKLMNPEQGGSPELYKLGLGSTECSDSLYFGKQKIYIFIVIYVSYWFIYEIILYSYSLNNIKLLIIRYDDNKLINI